ncbi:Na/Pi symporter [Ruania alba]|uniref:Solute carrier family 34 (Sodium-dependent phosphate cotransporter) n=1 Tax=Ruania alba TaxID=648782 RepID=A0A1H5CGM3_9MICO|nr:Na/Pi symporter [Ruania alba]SED65806.1 solute carrier family 34 (sodium-dependent phosphate cotransporter) [Ruania alba]
MSQQTPVRDSDLLGDAHLATLEVPSSSLRTSTASTPVEPPLRGPFDSLVPAGTARSIVNWLSVVVSVYLLISAVGVIGAGFKVATGGHAETLFAFASNPIVALMVGVLATAATQSSSTTTSITVGLAAGGLPLEIAIPIIMGANIGTTLTNTLVSVGMIRNKDDFRRAFAAATVHDVFNLIAVAILLPLELATGFLERLSGSLSGALTGVGGVDTDSMDVVGAATAPLKELMGALTGSLPALWAGLLTIGVGVALILVSIAFVGKVLKVLMVGRAKQVLHAAIGRGPISGITSGAVVTAIVQSSSTATSLMIPLAGSGTFTLRQVYPFTLGANIGTTITALVAALGLSGMEATLGLQVALVHLLFNLTATLVIFGLPFLRLLPVRAAQWLADRSAEQKSFAALWVLGVFVAVPGLLILATSIF